MNATPPDDRGRSTLRFVLPSLIGILTFLTPFPTEGGANIGIGILTDLVEGVLGAALPAIVAAAVSISALVSLYTLWSKPAWAERESGIGAVFGAGPAGVAVRVLGAVLAVMVVLQRGPAWAISADTGGVILNDLMTVIFVLFLFASVLLPFLTDFGLMEFIGTLVRPVFRTVFTLPGRAAVDGAASWFGSAVVGIIITTKQYEDGFYTNREAVAIATNFSVVSVAFCVVVINFVGLGEYFLPFYGAVLVSGMLAAMILPRLPPLSRKPETFYREDRASAERLPEGEGLLSGALRLARTKAASTPRPGAMLRDSLNTTFDIWFGLEPIVMVVGTLSLVIATYTPFFTWLSMPVVPFLELLRLPEAAAAAPAFVVGFADQFLPVILGQSLESDLTRFVIGCASVTQLIYMSEVGALLLKSRLKLGLGDLALIFVLRTLITVPVCAAFAHWLF